MKARFATILSLVGVLSAGSAAAMVNTRVLGNAGEAAATPALLSVVGTPTAGSIQLPTTVVVTAAPAVAPTSAATSTLNSGNVSSQMNTSSGVVTTNPASATTSPVMAPKVSVYNVGDAGSISIQSSGGTLSVTAVSPGIGWKVTSSNPSTPSSPATVILSSTSVEVTFTASLAGSNVVTNVTSRSLATPTTPTPTYNNDDDDDDEHDDDDDEHEDDDD